MTGEDRGSSAGNDRAPSSDSDVYREMAEELETLRAAAARLRELGEEAGVPAIERNAKRVADTATTLTDNLPPELTEE